MLHLFATKTQKHYKMTIYNVTSLLHKTHETYTFMTCNRTCSKAETLQDVNI